MAGGKIALLLVLVLVSAARPSLAQRSNGRTGGFTPTAVVMLTVVIAVLVLVTLFSLYMNRCACTLQLPRRSFRGAAPAGDHRPQLDADRCRCRPRGLGRELVEAFPTAVYGDVKAHVATARGTEPAASLECAVCLAEFADADQLRVLTPCCHVFHCGCVDPWLAGAVTCPLCRADLTAGSSGLAPPTGRRQESDMSAMELTGAEYDRSRRTQSAAMDAPDRHTLRLPEQAMKELGAVWRHRRAASLAAEHREAVDQRTPGRLTSFLRSMSWQRHHSAEAEAGSEEHGSGSKRIYPVTGAPVDSLSGYNGSGGNEKEESSDVGALSRV